MKLIFKIFCDDDYRERDRSKIIILKKSTEGEENLANGRSYADSMDFLTTT